MERRFGSTAPFTTGVEEEFQLIDPHTRELAQAAEVVIGAAPEGSEPMGREFFQNCVELRTPEFSDVTGLARRLPALRREISKAANKVGVSISGGGLHPSRPPARDHGAGLRCHRTSAPLKVHRGRLTRADVPREPKS